MGSRGSRLSVGSGCIALLIGGALPAVDRFEFELRPGRGFCAAEGQVIAATVVLGPGEPTAEIAVLDVVPADLAGAGCLRVLGLPAESCGRPRRIPPRPLAPDEAAALAAIVDRAAAGLLDAPDPTCGAVDYCRRRVFRFDGIETSDDPCAVPRVDAGDGDDLAIALDRLRVPGAALPEGDADGDGARDIGDAIRLLTWLFLAGPPPVDLRCIEDLPCLALGTVVLENGDVNGDRSRDIGDAVDLLAWLFAGGPAPRPLCSCATTAACGAGSCPEGDTCIPLRPEMGDFVCAGSLSTCSEVEGIYEFLVSDDGEECRPEIGCRLLRGYREIGLGACWEPLCRGVRQEHLDALARRFIELGGAAACGLAVAPCDDPPPAGAVLVGEGCRAAQ